MSEPTDIVPAPKRVDLGLLQADKPEDVVERGKQIAAPLAKVILDRGLYTEFEQKRYVQLEGWVTLAAMLGITPHEISTSVDEEGNYTSVMAMCATSDGREIARASAECGVDEPNWKDKPRYQRRSMAETRATSKACRLAFSWIIVLAGYEATPAEEMDGVKSRKRVSSQSKPSGEGGGRDATPQPDGPVPVCPNCEGGRELSWAPNKAKWYCPRSGGGCTKEWDVDAQELALVEIDEMMTRSKT